MTFEAYWSMLYSEALARIALMAAIESYGLPCSQMCWMHQLPN